MLHDFASAGVAGGSAYDALIAACAVEAQASVLLTFNLRHFAGLTGDVEVVSPGKRK